MAMFIFSYHMSVVVSISVGVGPSRGGASEKDWRSSVCKAVTLACEKFRRSRTGVKMGFVEIFSIMGM